MIILVIKTFSYTSSAYSCHLFLISSVSVLYWSIFSWNVPFVFLIFLKRALVFPILLFSSISLHWSLRKAFLSLLAILWNCAFKWVYLSFSPLLLASLLFSAISKASSDNYFAFLHFFVLGMVLITAICTMSQTSVHTSLGKIDIPSVKNHGLKAKGCLHLANIKLKAYWLKRANIYFPVSVGWQYFLWGSHKVEIKLWLWLQPSQSFPERWMFV